MSGFRLGLRAQLAFAIAVMLIGASAVALVLLENMLTRRLLTTREQHAASVVAALVALDEPARASIVASGTVDAVASPHGTHGMPALAARLNDASAYFVEDAVTYLRVEQGDVVAAFRVDDVRGAVASTRNALMPFGVLMVVTFAALSYGMLGFWVVRPLRAIRVATERAAAGDYASAIELRRRNELGDLAHSFNEMMRRIEVSNAELEVKIAQLETANQQLAETQESLIRSEKLASVGHLAAGVAHEIGNPLAAVSGYNELLIGDDLDASERLDILQRTARQIDRIRTVVRKLLDFSRDDSGVPAGPVDLAQCVEETVTLVRPIAHGVRFETADLEGPAVWAVAPQMVQVLVNLVMNAADAMEDGGRVVFKRDDGDDVVRLHVDDDGPGIAPEVASKLFEPFFTTKDPGHGTGLGLAISARLVEGVGGRLEVDTSPLGGARFTITLRRA